MKIGAMIESFRMDFLSAAKKAKSIGADGVQMYAQDVIHAGMTKKEIAEVKRVLAGEGLALSAVCGDFGCDMFYRPETNREAIEREKRVMEIAAELGTSVVTTHIGALCEDVNSPQYESMHKVCEELAAFAGDIGGHFAVETGPERASLLKSFLDTLPGRGVAVNLDPANLVMCSGDDPVQAVYTLKDYIVHMHAKDGLRIIPCDPRSIYAASYYGLGPAPKGCYREVPLGEGGVDWPRYLAALKEIGYDGYLTIERECGEDPAADIGRAARFLSDQLARI